jgi:hypothetical protein
MASPISARTSHGRRHSADAAVTIRLARPEDAEPVARLAALDSQRAPEGPLLVAEVDGELWAARSLADGASVADPFRPSGEMVLLLAKRAAQIRGAGSTPPRRGAWARTVGRLRAA